MKYLIFVFVWFAVFQGTSLWTSAQPKFNSRYTRTQEHGPRPVKFIDGIEIKRSIVPESETIIPAEPTIATAKAEPGDPAVEKSLPVQFKYALLLDKNVEAITNLPLFNFIEAWWEAPYHFGGTDKSGVDCSGFTGLLFSNVYKTDIPRTAKEQYSSAEKIDRDILIEGDLVFFNTRGGVSHVGVYLGDGYFVHANITNGVTINNLNDDYYAARFLGGGRIVKTADAVVKSGL